MDAGSLNLSTLAKPLLSLASSVWPKVRPLYAERKASRIPLQKNDLLDQLLSETYRRLTQNVLDESWWREIFHKLQHEYVAPEFLKFPHCQEWLARAQVRDDLLSLARAQVVGTTSDRLRERLAAQYSEVTGENPALAAGPISVVAAILGAGIVARLDASDFASVAIVTAKMDQLGGEISDSRAVRHESSIVSQVARARLTELLKRRLSATERSQNEIRALLKELNAGELAAADDKTKAELYRYGVRLHAGKEFLPQSRAYLEKAIELDPTADVRIPKALIMEAEENVEGALRLLREGGTADDRSAMFGVLLRTKGEQEALTWLDAQNPQNVTFATPIGWYVIVVRLVRAHRYQEAIRWLAGLEQFAEQLPDLVLLDAAVNAAMLVPLEHREHVLQLSVLHPAIHVVDGVDVDRYRKRAKQSFCRAAELLEAIDLRDRARIARQSLLWLGLMDPDPAVRSSAQAEVMAGMADPVLAVDLIRLASPVGIDFDIAPLKQHLAQRARWGGLTSNELVAEFLLTEKMPSLDRAKFIAKEEARLKQEIPIAALAGSQIDALIEGKDFAAARRVLEERRADLEQHDYQRLLAKLTAGEGGNPLAILEENYRTTQRLVDLHNLCSYLWSARDWKSAAPLLAQLFKKERNLVNATRFVTAMQRIDERKDGEIAEFLADNEDLVQRSVELQAAKAWSLFALGKGSDARAINDLLLKSRSDTIDLALDINIALQLGDWERFSVIVDREWSRRQELDADSLMRLATLASEADNSADRALDLAKLAALKSPSDPNVLIAAYALGFQLGRETAVDPEWLKKAVELSSEDGPVWQVDTRTLVEEMVPAHAERSRRIERDLLRGDIPLPAVAKALNVPLAALVIENAKQNETLADGRARSIIPIVVGGRPPVEISEAWRIALDVTSVMVLWSLGLLSAVLRALKHVVLPPDIMIVLLNERRKVIFHQPSRVAKAREIREMIDDGFLKVAEASTSAPSWLAEEVGRDLADLLVQARDAGGMVVRPLPVPKLASFLTTEADLKEFAPNVLSCTQLVAALHATGRIDAAMSRRAVQYLSAHDRGADANVAKSVLAGPLYLDDLALTYLESAGVLTRLAKTGLELRIHKKAEEEKSQLVKVERKGNELADALNEIRLMLRNALASGKAVLFASTRSESHDSKATVAELFPALSQILSDASSCDAISIDDRFFSRHVSIADKNGRVVSVVGLLDMVRFIAARGHIDEAATRNVFHRARKAGFTLLPIEKSELDHYLRQANIEEGSLSETDELKTIRQTLMRVRALEALSQPLETGFLDSLRLTSILEIRSLWSDKSLPTDRVEALSTWIWENLAPCPFHWAKTIREQSQVMAAEDAFVMHISILLQPILSLDVQRYTKFVDWCERVVVGPIELVNGRLLDKVAEIVATNIEKIVHELRRA